MQHTNFELTKWPKLFDQLFIWKIIPREPYRIIYIAGNFPLVKLNVFECENPTKRHLIVASHTNHIKHMEVCGFTVAK